MPRVNIVSINKSSRTRFLENLSFVRTDRDGGRNFWAVSSTGDYGLDCLLGKSLAKQAVAFLADSTAADDHIGGKYLLSDIVGSFSHNGTVRCGIEIGFWTEIGATLIESLKQSRAAVNPDSRRVGLMQMGGAL